ncbi:MAG: cation diffusion facilitator family transporter [Pseudomonadota bacterium]
MPHDANIAMPGAMPAQSAAKITKTVARLSVATALVLIALKLWAWLASGSVAMLSSLADSSLDGVASLFTLIAVSYAAMPPDEEHRYGHGKAEAFAAMVQAILVGVSATFVAIEAVARFRSPETVTQGPLAISVMVVSIALTLALLWAQTRAIRKTGSVATQGDRAHYAADLGANVAVIIGVAAAAYAGARWADPVVGLAVAAWLAWSAVDVARSGWDQLLDHELPDEARARIRELALSTGALMDIHQLRTRASGPYVHIQFHADMPTGLSLEDAHQRMIMAEQAILSEFPAADVLIHPDPRGAKAHGGEAFREDQSADG